MSVGSISSSSVAAGTYAAARPAAGESGKASESAEATGRTIADHVAEADEHAPVRSFNAKVGTLVDTYL